MKIEPGYLKLLYRPKKDNKSIKFIKQKRKDISFSNNLEIGVNNNLLNYQLNKLIKKITIKSQEVKVLK